MTYAVFLLDILLKVGGSAVEIVSFVFCGCFPTRTERVQRKISCSVVCGFYKLFFDNCTRGKSREIMDFILILVLTKIRDKAAGTCFAPVHR